MTARFAKRLAGRHSVVFLDYDRALTPIVDRPGDGVISDSMWDMVQALTQRCGCTWSAAATGPSWTS
jgi:trehalose-6-phosphatase